MRSCHLLSYEKPLITPHASPDQVTDAASHPLSYEGADYSSSDDFELQEQCTRPKRIRRRLRRPCLHELHSRV